MGLTRSERYKECRRMGREGSQMRQQKNKNCVAECDSGVSSRERAGGS